MMFYFLDDKLVTCKYKHTEKGVMISDDENFLWTNGIVISNDRNHQDIAAVDDNFYYGMISNNHYPKILSGEYP